MTTYHYRQPTRTHRAAHRCDTTPACRSRKRPLHYYTFTHLPSQSALTVPRNPSSSRHKARLDKTRPLIQSP
jgi:hypothetical protein